MSNKQQALIVIIVGGIVFGSLFMVALTNKKLRTELKLAQDQNQTTIVYKDKIVYKEPKGNILSITMADLNDNLKTVYKHLSSKQRGIMLASIAKASDKYNISPIVIYGLISVESSFRTWITHKQVTIEGKKDNGVGLGGIISIWWLDKLRKANIVETKSDLYNADNNIQAIGFILAEYKTMPLIKGTYDPITSALRRYFGGNYRTYSQKIKNQIGAIIFAKIYK